MIHRAAPDRRGGTVSFSSTCEFMESFEDIIVPTDALEREGGRRSDEPFMKVCVTRPGETARGEDGK